MRKLRALPAILILTLIFIGLIIGFFVTGYSELLFIAVLIGIFDFIYICLSIGLIIGVTKMIYKGVTTGDWHD